MKGIAGVLASEGGPVFYDSFTGANNTLLPAHTPDVGGLSWVSQPASGRRWNIQGNRALVTATDGTARDLITPASMPKKITCVMRSSVVGIGFAVILRSQDANNAWFAQINYALNALQIYEQTGGTYTLRSSTTYPPGFVTDTDYAATIDDSLTAITLTIGSYSVTYSTTSRNTQKTCGIQGGSTGAVIDDFRIVGVY